MFKRLELAVANFERFSIWLTARPVLPDVAMRVIDI
jgi:hypothetical protein